MKIITTILALGLAITTIAQDLNGRRKAVLFSDEPLVEYSSLKEVAGSCGLLLSSGEVVKYEFQDSLFTGVAFQIPDSAQRKIWGHKILHTIFEGLLVKIETLDSTGGISGEQLINYDNERCQVIQETFFDYTQEGKLRSASVYHQGKEVFSLRLHENGLPEWYSLYDLEGWTYGTTGGGDYNITHRFLDQTSKEEYGEYHYNGSILRENCIGGEDFREYDAAGNKIEE